jgi:quinol monooxygenase YgiN
MKLIVAGTVRIPPENLERFRAQMVEMIAASRAEDGCIDYAYAQDVADPGLIRVFEVWRDEAALAAHFLTEHMARWRAAWPQFGVSERKLAALEVVRERPI